MTTGVNGGGGQFARVVSDQPFSNLDFLQLLPTTDFDQGRAVLNEVILDAERAGICWSEFERGKPDSVRRIALGVAERQKAKDVAMNDKPRVS
jgi:hypothetical protein